LWLVPQWTIIRAGSVTFLAEYDYVTTGNLDRGLAIVELLAANAPGLPMHEIADRLNIPRSATHRLLVELIRHGYVRQQKEYGEYTLTLKLCSLGLSQLSGMGVVDISQPILDELARISGEVARLSVIDGDQLVWVAKAQGSSSGLRFDPDMGGVVDLLATASGHAWLSSLSEESALELVTKQGGFVQKDDYGPSVPRTVQDLLKMLHETRVRGFSVVSEAVHLGIAAVAAPVKYPVSGHVIGVISVAGPHLRLTDERLEMLGPIVVAASNDLAKACAGSPFLKRAIAAAGRSPSFVAASTRKGRMAKV
jgi:DNA-binding IclR family transcriptional regulator